MNKVTVEFEEINGTYSYTDTSGAKQSIMFGLPPADCSSKHAKDKVSILKDLTEMGISPRDIIELKEQGLL